MPPGQRNVGEILTESPEDTKYAQYSSPCLDR